MTQRCTKCREEKPLSAFYPRKDRKSGISTVCRPCRNAHARAKWLRVLETDYDTHYRRYRNRWIKSTYGITIEEFDAMLAAQENRCAICRTEFQEEDKPRPGGRARLHIDHDHTTGRVRGLLCVPCNLMLGGSKDNPATLRSAILYLGRVRAVRSA